MTQPKPFLQTVAEAYATQYDDLSDVCFVFTNKRSGSFFRKYLSQALATTSLLPEITTISDLVADLSGMVADNSLNLIFRLYNCYCDYCNVTKSNGDPVEEFDRFRPWGEIVLRDFDEIDMQMANADEVFKNLKDYRSIASNFLNDSQLKVMREYFGYDDTLYDRNNMWKAFDDSNDSKGIQKKFYMLWQILSPLYHKLHSELAESGLTTPGGAYRCSAERLKKEGEAILSAKKYVFIGFNVLSRSERDIFDLLKALPSGLPDDHTGSRADFFWDATGPFLKGTDNPAAHFVNLDKEAYPHPEWALEKLHESDTNELPTLDVYSVPSNSAQIKLMSTHIAGDNRYYSNEDLKDARVAVVLPDEGLLQPLLYSLPECVKTPNLTMGYPMKQTSVVSFVSLLRALHTRQRSYRNERNEQIPGFFYNDLRIFLTHPYSQALFTPAIINKTLANIVGKHRFTVEAEDLTLLRVRLEKLEEGAGYLLTPLKTKSSPEDVVNYLFKMLGVVSKALRTWGNDLLKSKLELQNIDRYCDALRCLRASFTKYGIRMDLFTTFIMANRLISSQTVPFEGEPLSGFQVMGMLETRALDFRNVYIPSLNEKIMPKRSRLRTFIPNVLRYAYGLPPANYQESIFAYYFFRLLSRVSYGRLYYDARVGENRGGGISRYLLQLKHIYGGENIRFHTGSFLLSKKDYEPESVRKEGKVLDFLNDFITGKTKTPRKLSATALTKYIDCGKRFFYNDVLNLKDDSEPMETIDAMTSGNIIHGAMEEIYLPEATRKDMRNKLLDKSLVINKKYIEGLLTDYELQGKKAGHISRLDKVIHHMINYHHFGMKKEDDDLDQPLKGSAALLKGNYVKQVANILRHDLREAPFRIYGCELKEKMTLAFHNNSDAVDEVNITFAIDRLDRSGSSGDTPFRIVDYKTGYVHLQLESDQLDDVFRGEYACKNVFQLLFYAKMLRKFATDNECIDDATGSALIDSFERHGIKLEIYHVPKILNGDCNFISIGRNQKIPFDTDLLDTFSSLLDNLLAEIFNPGQDFRPADDNKNCGYCAFKEICRQ